MHIASSQHWSNESATQKSNLQSALTRCLKVGTSVLSVLYHSNHETLSQIDQCHSLGGTVLID